MKNIYRILIILIAIMIFANITNALTTNSTVIDTNTLEYNIKKDKIKSLFQPIDIDARKYIDGNKSSKELNDLSDFQIKKNNKELDEIVDELQRNSGKFLDEDSKEKFKRLIIKEHYNNIERELEIKNFKKTTRETNITNIVPTIYRRKDLRETVYSISLPANTNYPIRIFAQVRPDIYGGKGKDKNNNPFNTNGNNNLHQISVENGKNCILSTCNKYTKYTLYFNDEDHPDPTIDLLYDYWRQFYYGRSQDIESFIITNGVINFNDIWDNNKAYAEFYGQHGTITRNYAPNSRIFISNVWNHAMDTFDKNPNIGKILWLS